MKYLSIIFNKLKIKKRKILVFIFGTQTFRHPNVTAPKRWHPNAGTQTPAPKRRLPNAGTQPPVPKRRAPNLSSLILSKKVSEWLTYTNRQRSMCRFQICKNFADGASFALQSASKFDSKRSIKIQKLWLTNHINPPQLLR